VAGALGEEPASVALRNGLRLAVTHAAGHPRQSSAFRPQCEPSEREGWRIQSALTPVRDGVGQRRRIVECSQERPDRRAARSRLVAECPRLRLPTRPDGSGHHPLGGLPPTAPAQYRETPDGVLRPLRWHPGGATPTAGRKPQLDGIISGCLSVDLRRDVTRLSTMDLIVTRLVPISTT
jgi:hypothetical protein